MSSSDLSDASQSDRPIADFLQLCGRRCLVFGVANRKSVAYAVAQTLEQAGAEVVYVVRSEQRRQSLAKLLAGRSVWVCDVERQEEIDRLAEQLAADSQVPFHGLLHSIAFADYSQGVLPFHQTGRQQFLQAVDISCFSLIALCRALEPLLDRHASVVTISISTTRMASESYGFMAPVKAALDSSLVFLAKAFSRFSEIRFNAVAAGLLKTSSSAGIPGYVDAYLYAEQVIPRGRAVQTQEVADASAFLLSPRSSGINAQSLVVDAGMEINYFDQQLVRKATGG